MDYPCPPLKLFPEKFSPELNKDFRKIVAESKKFCGGLIYHQPIESMRYALNLDEKYEDKGWLGVKQDQSEKPETTNEWPVSYHGTSSDEAIEIVRRGGFKMPSDSPQARIHTVTDPKIALGFAQAYHNSKGESFKLLFQVRVDLQRADVIKKDGVEFWRAHCVDAIRPYAICVYRIE